jgi:hypothetical protein
MKTSKTISLLALLILLVTTSSVHADDALRVTGTDGAIQTWTLAKLKETCAADIKPVEFTSRGEKHTSNGVPLLAVLKAAGVPVDLKMDPKADPRLKNYNLRFAVVVQGGDGYTATFSLAELQPEIGAREAWLVFDEDGKPLPDRDGAMKLIVPTDQKPARWVRNVATVTVIDPSPTTRPALKGNGQ